MRLFGLTISRQKAAPPVPVAENRGGWFPLIKESFTGSWQRGITVDRNTVLSNPTVFACATLITSDIAKLRVKLVEQDTNGIWSETSSPAYSPVLRKPNRMQNRIQFWEGWILSKLLRGNAYILKQREGRTVVKGLYVLDPARVTPMVTDDGEVYYQLRADNVVGIKEDVMVPASEIIHDRWNCIFHPLIGTSPIFANGLAAIGGLEIQANSVRLFRNSSRPGGILTAPGKISQETADRLKSGWEDNFTGENAGRVAVLGDGLEYKAMVMTAVDAQLIEQLKWSAETICSCFHVPAFKVGVGPMPNLNSVQSLNMEYYMTALQRLIEDAEICLDEGLGIGIGEKIDGKTYGTEFDLDNLLRMDSIAQMNVLKEGVGAAIMAPNEARKRLDLKPVEGGESPMAQQQNFSLAALAERDRDKPFAKANPASPAADAPPANDNSDQAREARSLWRRKAMATLLNIDTISIGTHDEIETRSDPGRAMAAQGASR